MKESRFLKWVRHHSPTREELLANAVIKPFSRRIAHSHLWRFTRLSVPRGVALGLIVGIFLLIPGIQILGVALLALPFRANIPVGAAMTFLSNPFTTPFLLAASVWIGNNLFGLNADIATWSALSRRDASAGEWLSWVMSDAAPATLTGLFVIALVSAIIGYVLSSIIWDAWIRLRWKRKKK